MKGIPRLIMDSGQANLVPVITIINAEPKHIAQIKKNLRSEDAREVLRLGVSVQHALWYSYKHSIIRKAALIDGEVAALWGCMGVAMGNNALPWLLTAPCVKKISPLRFARIYQEEVISMLKIFKTLENYVDEEYSSAIRLLEIIGFILDEPQKIGVGMFRKFRMEAAK